jgi:hypothetical protein
MKMIRSQNPCAKRVGFSPAVRLKKIFSRTAGEKIYSLYVLRELCER